MMYFQISKILIFRPFQNDKHFNIEFPNSTPFNFAPLYFKGESEIKRRRNSKGKINDISDMKH